MSWRRNCATAEVTQLAGEQFASVLRSGDVVLLEGSLGAGKTTFTQGIARGLGVSERVTSPTFTVVRQHRCHHRSEIRTLHHADVYRTESVGEIIDLALGELVEEDAVAVVEWGELAASVMGPDVIRVIITVDDHDVRTFEIDGAATKGRESAFEQWATA